MLYVIILYVDYHFPIQYHEIHYNIVSNQQTILQPIRDIEICSYGIQRRQSWK